MEPRQLLAALMARDGDNPNSLARKLEGKIRQPQIHKFVRGEAREPRRATLQPLADHYGIPIETFYSPELAASMYAQMGLSGTPGVREPPASHSASPTPIRPVPTWPFQLVSYKRFTDLPREARQDIENHLEILALKWEKALQTKKFRPS